MYSVYYLLDGWITDHLNKRKLEHGILRVNPVEAYKTWLSRLTNEAKNLTAAIGEIKESKAVTSFKSTFEAKDLKTLNDYEVALSGINNLIAKLQAPHNEAKQINYSSQRTGSCPAVPAFGKKSES